MKPPLPGVLPKVEEIKAKAKAKRAEPSDWTEIGKNAIGQTLYQDQRGVRSYVENGVRVTETVGIRPGRQGVAIEIMRKPDDVTWNVAPAKPVVPHGTIAPVDAAAHAAATSPTNDLPEPTEPQKEAGNYQKGHPRIAGLDISIESPVGSERTGTTRRGVPWRARMRDHYGYIRRTVGADGNQVDVFVKGGTPEDYDGPVFVIDQKKANGHFDEHKVMLGWATETSARIGYLRDYRRPWDGVRSITRMTMPEFKAWLQTDTTTPAAETIAPEPATKAAERETKGAKPETKERWESFEVRPAPGREGRFLVYEPRGEGGVQNLAEFSVGKAGQPTRIQHFFEAPSTRGPTLKAMGAVG